MKWPFVPIEVVCDPTGFVDPRRDPGRPFRYVDISSIDRDRKTIQSAPEILGEDAPSRARKEIKTSDVLVSTVRPNLNAVAIVPPELDGQVASTGFCVLRPKKEAVSGKYLFYYALTKNFIVTLSGKVRGAHYPAVSDADVKVVELPLALPSEQRRIVEILDQADALRKKRAEADAKAARILPALFYKMFGDPATNPKGRTTEKLGKLTIHLTSGSRGWAQYTGRGDALFVRTQDVNDSEIAQDLLPVDPPAGAEADRTRLAPRDVVVTITGMVGKAAVFTGREKDVYVSQHVALVRLDQDSIVPEFFAAYANLPVGNVPLLARFQYGQTKPGLGFRELQAAVIPVPPLGLQRRFCSDYGGLLAIRRLRRQAEARVQYLWTALLSRAFAGDLTAKWREACMKELLAEMESQAKLLG